MINLKETIEYKNYGFKIVKCPICGEETLDSFWICENCNWEYDGALSDNTFSFANGSTLKDYKNKFQKTLDKK